MFLLVLVFSSIFIFLAVIYNIVTFNYFQSQDAYWSDIYKKALLKEKDFWSLGYRIESMELSLKYEESLFKKYEDKISEITSKLNHHNGLLRFNSKTAPETKETHDTFSKELIGELKNLLLNTTKSPYTNPNNNNLFQSYVTFHCGEDKNYIRIGQNDFSSSVENECYTFVSSMKLSTSASSDINFSPNYIFKIEYIDNWKDYLDNTDSFYAIKVNNLRKKYADIDYSNLSFTEDSLIPYDVPFLIRSLSNNRYVRVISPPNDAVYVPFLFESSGITPYLSDFFILRKEDNSLRSLLFDTSPIRCMPPNDLFHSNANRIEQIMKNSEEKSLSGDDFNEEISNNLNQEIVYQNSYEAMFGGDGNLLKGFIDSTVSQPFYFESVSEENYNKAQKLLAISNIILKNQNSHLYDHKIQREKEHKEEELIVDSTISSNSLLDLYSKFMKNSYGPANVIDITGRESIPVALLVTLTQFSLNSDHLDNHVFFTNLLPSLISSLNFNSMKYKIKIFIGIEDISIDFNKNFNIINNINDKKKFLKLAYEDIFLYRNNANDFTLEIYKKELVQKFYSKIIDFIKVNYLAQDNRLSKALKAAIDNDHFSVACYSIDNLSNLSKDAPISLSSSILYFNSPSSANTLSKIAIQDNFEYFMHLTDQSKFNSGNWLHSIINRLYHSPILPNFGVVGITDEMNPSTIMLPLVHRTHIDIFDGFYPRSLEYSSRDYVIEWLNLVYGEEFRARIPNYYSNCPSDQLSNSPSQLFLTLFTNLSQKTRVKLIREQHDLQEAIKVEILSGHSKINKWLKLNNFPRLSLPHVCGYIPSVIHLEKYLDSQAT